MRIRRQISGGIGLVAVLIFVFGIYFLFSAPASNSRSSETNRSKQFSQERLNETAPPEPTYDLALLPRIEVGHPLEFGLDNDNRTLPANRALLAGWSVPEHGGIWSLGRDTVIGFVVHCEPIVCGRDDAVLLFECMAFVAPGHPQQRIEVWVGKRKMDQVVLSTPMNKFPIALEGETIKDGAPIILSLHLPDAIVRGKITNSNDPREVALRIKSLRLEL